MGIAIDVIGDATYLVPGAAESCDLGWAPLNAVLLKLMFDGRGVAAVGLIEEIMPFTDFLPWACIAWTLETAYPDGRLTRFLGLCPVIVQDSFRQGQRQS